MVVKKNMFIFVLCSLLAFCLMVSLGTWHPNDATLFSASTLQRDAHNMLGFIGAHLSAFLIFSLGISAFLFIPFFIYLAFFFVRKKKLKYEWDAFLGWILLIVSVSVMNAFYHVSFFLPFSAGGYCGQLMFSLLKKQCDLCIIQLFFGVSLFVSITLITRFSFIGIATYIKIIFSYLICFEQFMRPAIKLLLRIFQHTFNFMYQKLYFSGTFLWSLFNGNFIDEQGESIVTFEFDEVIEEIVSGVEYSHKELNQIESDEHYFQEIVPKEDVSPRYGTSKLEKSSQLTQAECRYNLPPRRLFSKIIEKYESDDEGQAEQQLAQVLEEKLARFGVVGTVVSIKSGPVITLFEYQPHIDAKISKIIALEDDLALALQAVSIRIIAPIPGKSVVGFEVAKKQRHNVLFSSIVHAATFQENGRLLPLVFGHDTIGNTVIVDLTTMPHLLVAGSTGSGKSVAMNVMLMSLLCKKTPQELKLILIDPKRLEFAAYADIGHLIFPIITEPKETAPVLQWVVKTMEERYVKMAAMGARNIADYESLRKQYNDIEHMPYIVIMIDEFADLMMVVGKEIEGLIARIAQMARAAGIHMIIATQRPSVDVITGLIKVNFPSRISFRVTTKVDSRTILDCGGAEKLLGKGDMLYLDSSSSCLRRVHGAYVSDAEITSLVSFIRAQQPPHYLELRHIHDEQKGNLLAADDDLYKEIVIFIKTIDEISISLLQRRFRIGYNRSARIIEMLELEGYILPSDGGKLRKVVH